MPLFFHRLRNCFTSPKSYKALVEGEASAGWFLYWIFVICTFVSGTVIAVSLLMHVPLTKQFASDLSTDLQNLYPEKLVVTVKDGKLSTNQKEPYSIEFPERWAKALFKEGAPVPHMVTFDTKASADSYDAHKTVVFFTKTSAIYPRKTNTTYNVDGTQTDKLELAFQPLSEVQDITVNKEMYDGVYTAISPWVRAIPSLVITTILLALTVGPFVIAGFKLLGFLIYLLLATWLVLALATVMSRKMPYWTLYRLTAFASIVPISIATVAGVFGTWLPFLGFTLILAVWTGVILQTMPKKSASAQ